MNTFTMKEDSVSFETAKLAKRCGFAVPVYYGVSSSKMNLLSKPGKGTYNWNTPNKHTISIPTQALLQKWIREVQGIHINVLYPTEEKDYINTPHFKIQILEKIPQHLAKKYTTRWDFRTYEEALEIGLVEALKLI
jgi:hypothetical protein